MEEYIIKNLLKKNPEITKEEAENTKEILCHHLNKQYMLFLLLVR